MVTSSRAVAPGDLFIALRGPRFDGHSFLGEVAAQGAVGAVVDRDLDQPDAAMGVIVVADTLQALQRLAHAVRVAAGTRLVAITGSAGKTTTKETIAAMLATRYRVVKNKGNLNNHIGLPLSLMQLRDGPDVAVMELGMNHAGEISTLVAIAEPDVRVWTNVGDAHIGFFASADAIADAKAEVLERARPDTVLVCNADDARVMARVSGFPRAHGGVRHGRRGDGSCRRGRGPRPGRYARDTRDARRSANADHAVARARQPVERPCGCCRRARVSACRWTTSSRWRHGCSRRTVAARCIASATA